MSPPTLAAQAFQHLVDPAALTLEAVRDLVDQVTAADGTAPLSEHVLLHLPYGGDAEVRTLKAAQWQGGHVMPTGDALMSGYYLNELLMRLLARDDPHPGLFDAYAAAVRLLATPFAVVTGLTYNFLPFMVLPIYASLERADPRVIEAGGHPQAQARKQDPQHSPRAQRA